MAISFNPGNILHGNDGKLWMGGDEILTGISLEAKLTIDTENVSLRQCRNLFQIQWLFRLWDD